MIITTKVDKRYESAGRKLEQIERERKRERETSAKRICVCTWWHADFHESKIVAQLMIVWVGIVGVAFGIFHHSRMTIRRKNDRGRGRWTEWARKMTKSTAKRWSELITKMRKEHSTKNREKKRSLTKCNPLLLVCFYGNIRCYSFSFWFSLFTISIDVKARKSDAKMRDR